MNNKIAFQNQIPQNHCFGCGPENSRGLQIKSYWTNDDESICHFIPSSHHSAGPTKILNGGIISTIIDCHCICTAVAKGYQMADREIGKGDVIRFATEKLEVSFKKPVTIKEVTLNAKVITAKENKITLKCNLFSEGEICAQGRVTAVRVSNKWFE